MENYVAKNLNTFFQIDSKLKNQISQMCPPGYDVKLEENDIYRYRDFLYKNLEDVFINIKKVSSYFFNNDIIEDKINSLEKNIKNNFTNCLNDIDLLREFYDTNISNMKMNFLSNVKRECMGYINNKVPLESLNEITTINELLYLIHSSIVNNETYYEKSSSIKEKLNDNNELIYLRGNETKLGNNLFNSFPIDLDCSGANIISLTEDKALIMIKDLGYATQLEITKNKDKYTIDYFIPRIDNINDINNLPGVTKVSDNKIGARGSFDTSSDDLYIKFYDFLFSIPNKKMGKDKRI